ncbi:MAG: serine/threonine protein kinase, partial [Clostridiales bacterium]|nr:serine/threonine protein kinase [Clostridiales bacterium]
MGLLDKYEDGLWHIESEIGKGSFGQVYLISKVEYGFKSYSALKVIPVPQSNSEIGQMQSEGMDDASISEYIGEMVHDIMHE